MTPKFAGDVLCTRRRRPSSRHWAHASFNKGTTIAISDLSVPAEKATIVEHTLSEQADLERMFQRGLLTRNENGELTVATTGHQGSHIFSSFSQGNCFIVLERERGRVEAAEWVEVEPFNHLLGGL